MKIDPFTGSIVKAIPLKDNDSDDYQEFTRNFSDEEC
jgi:hypothetical protein